MFELVFKPLNYLSIRWDGGLVNKKRFDYHIPMMIAVVFGLLLTYILSVPNLSNTNFFLNDISGSLVGFLQTMPGFYIAALAAVSTLNSSTMDQPMAGNPPEEKLIERNPYKVLWVPLNRRRFLSRLFSYLSFVSISLFLIIVAIKFLYSLKITVAHDLLVYLGYFSSTFIVFFLLSQLVIMTFLSLYYLGERVHKN